jgi:UDPglucose 6-dehydrogenase
MPVVEAARQVNYRQRQRAVGKLLSELQTLSGRTVGLLGLAFKPHTDDIRDAPALDIARGLIAAGATVKAHDPVALARARAELSLPGLLYCETVQVAAQDCDALILATEWPQYRDLPWHELAAAMRSPVILDGRNFLDPQQLQRAGFRYLGMGRHSGPPLLQSLI